MGETILSSPPATYMVDTNVFRYKAYNIGDLSAKDEQAKQQHQLNAKGFFEKAFVETENREAFIMASGETRQELSVQAHTLKKESKRYNKLLEKVQVEESEIPLELEYMLRDFSNYVRGKYPGALVSEGRSTNYLQTPDARIFIHAYLNDAILVTANIKDFFLYPLFFEKTEDDVLYDISSCQYEKILPTGREKIESDEFFQRLQEKMREFKGN